MADTFSTMYRQLKLWVPELPIFLAQRFIRDRYRRIAERRPWAALRAEGEFIVEPAYTDGLVTVTRSSATIVGTGTAWTDDLVGRQLLVGATAPVYTVTAVADATHLTIDRVYGGDSATDKTYRLLQAYITVPTDFRSFMLVLDPRRRWRLRHWVTQAELAKMDPARTTTGTPWAVVDRRFTSTGLASYELWPYPVAASNYPYFYIKRAADLAADADVPFSPLRGDEIVRGALADLARWPGTAEHPNPMFAKALELAAAFETESESMLIELERQDEETMLTWLADASWNEWPAAPIDAAFMQCHSY